MNNLIVLRIAIAIILLSHGIPGMFDNGINDCWFVFGVSNIKL